MRQPRQRRHHRKTGGFLDCQSKSENQSQFNSAMSNFDSVDFDNAIKELDDLRTQDCARVIRNEQVRFCFMKRRIPFAADKSYVGWGSTYTEAILMCYKDIHQDAQHDIFLQSDTCPICQLKKYNEIKDWDMVFKGSEVNQEIGISSGNLFKMYNEF